MPTERKRIYDVMDLSPGNLTLTDVTMEKWGSILQVHITYRYPPQIRYIQLTFSDVRGIEWNVQRNSHDIDDEQEAQLMTHDLGESNYQRTARFASTMVELIFSYRKMKTEVKNE